MAGDPRAVPLLYADSSLFCRFEETLSWTGLLALVDYFGDSLRIVTDVNRELEGHVDGEFPGINMMKKTPMRDEFLRVAADPLPPNLAMSVSAIARTFSDASKGGRFKNHGEVATVLKAAEVGAAVIIDDFNGRAFADLRFVDPVFSTRDVAVAMVADGRLSEDDGFSIWTKVYTHDSGKRPFLRAVALFRHAHRP